MIAHGLVNSFMGEILQGIHTPSDVYRLALYTSSAIISPATTRYTTDGEVVAEGGYGAGGLTLTGYQVVQFGHIAILDFADPTWPKATIRARGALIYNFSKGNRAVVVLDFGKDITSTNGNFTVTLPPPTADAAVIAIAAGA